MKLPIEASDDDGILTKNGTMIYGKEDDAVTIGVQPLKDETGNVSFEGVRTLITINESTASKEYTFAYDLPEGYSLITAKDYYCDIIDNEAVNENDYDTGEVYIVNKDNVIDTVIDAAWAVDANGNDVDTYYVVNGNILTQVVNFDEKTTFSCYCRSICMENCKMCSCNRFDRCGYSYCGSESCKSSKIH